MGRYAIAETTDLDEEVPVSDEHRVVSLSPEQVERYSTVMRIILQAAEDQGMGPEAIICEDLGTLTEPVKATLKQLGLSGVRVTQFVDPAKPKHLYRGMNVEPQARHYGGQPR